MENEPDWRGENVSIALFIFQILHLLGDLQLYDLASGAYASSACLILDSRSFLENCLAV